MMDVTVGSARPGPGDDRRGGARFVRARDPRDRALGLLYYLKGRYVRAAFRHPSLFVEALRTRDLPHVLERSEELEFGSPTMLAMRHAALTKADPEFTFDGRRYPYLYDDFNHAWGTERTVEVPIGLLALGQVPAARAVEVGNVLGHYGAAGHAVVDKFELGPNVVNVDAVEYVPPQPVDRVVSVSTVEHIGWDEVPRDRGKIPRAIARFRSWLAPGGEAWITVPLGYNRWLDRMVAYGELGPDRAYFLRRLSFDNRWEQCSYAEVARARYGGPIDRVPDGPPYPRANALGVFVFHAA